MYEIEFKSGSFAEIYQQVNMQFAFCLINKTGDGKTKIKQLHGFVLCRDFLGDALVASNREDGVNIYNFSWNQTTDGKIPSDKTYLLIKYENKEGLQAQLNLLNKIETELSWKKSELINLGVKSENIPVFLVISTKKWISSTVLISIYTMLWRLSGVKQYGGEKIRDYLDVCIDKEKIGKWTNDQGYLKNVVEKAIKFNLDDHIIMFVLKNSNKIFKLPYTEIEKKEKDTDYIHYNNGIVSFITNAASKPKDFKCSRFGDIWQKNLLQLLKKD